MVAVVIVSLLVLGLVGYGIYRKYGSKAAADVKAAESTVKAEANKIANSVSKLL